MSGLTLLQAGTLFAGDYRIVRPLKEGGMGAVYVVEQISTAEQRALKVMQPELVNNTEARRRFEREARIGSQIKSDFVVKVIQAGIDDATRMPWLAMELLEGEDLESHLNRNTLVSPSDTLEIFDQLCDAVGAAHQAGIVHRDLKPENIFLAAPRRRRDRFQVKVLDFGIARILAEAQTTASKTRNVLGTPLFMAPEQARPGSSIDPRTDVWALGLIAFRMLTGRHFWRTAYDPSPTVMMLAMEAYMDPLPIASERAAQWGCSSILQPAFDAWFARCVSRDPGGRFVDARHAFEAFSALFGSLPEGARGSILTPPSAVVPFPLSPPTPASTIVAIRTEPMPAPSLVGHTEQMPFSQGDQIGATAQNTAQVIPQADSASTVPGSKRALLIVAGTFVAAVAVAGVWRIAASNHQEAALSAPTAPTAPTSSATTAAVDAADTTTTSTPVDSASSSVSSHASGAAPEDAATSISKPKRPLGSASIGGASVSGGSIANASAVVAGMAAGFRRCYNNGLKEDPNMKGSVRVTARIGPNGEILSASASGGGGLSGSVVSCVQARVASAQFAPPDGGGATVVIPVTFVSQ